MSYWIGFFCPHAQLSDFQREVIVLFKKEHQRGVYVNVEKFYLFLFFCEITTDQYRGVSAALKSGGSPAAKRKHGTGTSCTHNTPTKRAVLDRVVTPPDHRRRHSS